MVLCVDDAAPLSSRKEDTLVLTRTTSIQTYTLLPGTPAAVAAVEADLVIADCQERPARPLQAARLQDSRAAQPSVQTVIQSVVVAGPDTNPQHIAADQMLVSITLEEAIALDAELILVLADGTRWPIASRAVQRCTTWSHCRPVRSRRRWNRPARRDRQRSCPSSSPPRSIAPRCCRRSSPSASWRCGAWPTAWSWTRS